METFFPREERILSSGRQGRLTEPGGVCLVSFYGIDMTGRWKRPH